MRNAYSRDVTSSAEDFVKSQLKWRWYSSLDATAFNMFGVLLLSLEEGCFYNGSETKETEIPYRMPGRLLSINEKLSHTFQCFPK